MLLKSVAIPKPMQQKMILATYVFLFCLAAVLRFYELSDPPHPAFDEVYFPKYAYAYKKDEHFHHSHPPLARYVLFLGMSAYHAMPWIDDSKFGESEFDDIDPVSYRWVNASLGLMLCAFVAMICWRLSRSHLFTLMALGFVATDGALVVASRFGLSNAHITFWGFLGLYLFVRALQNQLPNKFLLFSIICFGSVVAVKWNGLAYLVIALAILLGVLLATKVFKLVSKKSKGALSSCFWPGTAFEYFNPKKTAILLLIVLSVPPLLYRVIWIPDRLHNDNVSFSRIHEHNWGYHSNAESVGDHPYCSAWYTWPIMKRPIGYYFKNVEQQVDGKKKKIYTDVHSFGNPILYWISSLAIAIVVLWFLWDSLLAIARKPVQRDFYIRAFISVGYLGSWLPWAFVSRCTFLYHYQTSSVFAFLAFAWLLTRLNMYRSWGKYPVIVLLAVTAASFIYFLPFSLGIELPSPAFYDRMWFQSWI